MFKVHDHSANKMGFSPALRCEGNHAPFVAKPAMQLLGLARRYREVTSSLKCQSNVDGNIFVNLFKRMYKSLVLESS